MRIFEASYWVEIISTSNDFKKEKSNAWRVSLDNILKNKQTYKTKTKNMENAIIPRTAS